MIKLNKKAFTLIEVLAIIVILGIILGIAIPIMSKVVNENTNKSYSNYYKLIKEASELYSTNLKDKLGTSKDIGCAEITLEELIDLDYIKEFNNNNATCKTGINNIKIRNDKGKLTINFQLNCSSEDEDTYIEGFNDSNTCDAYIEENEQSLKTTIETSNIEKTSVNDDIYIIDENPNNYIWYSGKMWRIVSYNEVTETVKIVTDNSISSIYYNSSSTKGSIYEGSDIELWLNTEFLNSLKDNQTFIINTNWNSTPNSSIINNPISSDKIIKSKIGLLTTFDYGKVNKWYWGESWLISEGTSGNSLYTSGGEVKSISSETLLGVRPAVVLNSFVQVYSGTGTEDDPYIIDNSENAIGKENDYLNTRYSGEYLKIGDNKYRIVSIKNGTVKVIGTEKIDNYVFSNDSYDYSSSTLKETLETTLTSEMKFAVLNEYCLDTINNSSLTYQSSLCLTPSRVNSTIKIGLPKIGDLFTTNIKNLTETYWTLNPNTESDGSGNIANATINVISPTSKVETSIISNKNATIIVLYINSNAKIVSGIGTSLNPYIINL